MLSKDLTQVLSVSALNNLVRSWLEQCFTTINVEGEISNYVKAASGHIYFTLKDSSAQIKCILFKPYQKQQLDKPLENGEKIIVSGMLSLYEARGDYQFIVYNVRRNGLGEALLKFEATKKRLQEKGLFKVELKKQIPKYPQKIGIISSKHGAALHDILSTIQKRFPTVKTKIYHCEVQGNTAHTQIINALITADNDKNDVLILARGGGSIEDLQAFNDENLAHTIFALNTPIITGIGHETDFTIADFVADIRAPTPTGAAMYATPDIHELLSTIKKYKQNLINHSKIILQYFQTIELYRMRCMQIYSSILKTNKLKVANIQKHLETLNPKATLARGYALIKNKENLIKNITEVAIGDSIDIILNQGLLKAKVTDIQTEDSCL